MKIFMKLVSSGFCFNPLLRNVVRSSDTGQTHFKNLIFKVSLTILRHCKLKDEVDLVFRKKSEKQTSNLNFNVQLF